MDETAESVYLMGAKVKCSLFSKILIMTFWLLINNKYHLKYF